MPNPNRLDAYSTLIMERSCRVMQRKAAAKYCDARMFGHLHVAANALSCLPERSNEDVFFDDMVSNRMLYLYEDTAAVAADTAETSRHLLFQLIDSNAAGGNHVRESN